MMNLEKLCTVFEDLQFPSQGVQMHPDRESLLKARSAVETAIVDDHFLADCISHELHLIEENRLRFGLAPFFIMPNLGIRFAFGYWAPGSTPGPHEHTAWTITAVCRNELEVLTYNREESYKRRELVPKNHFYATAGQVGFIYEPCIHEPRNTSLDWSLSLHISSPRDGEYLGDYEELLPRLDTPVISLAERDHPYTQVMIARQRQTLVHQISRILVTMDGPQVSDLLTQCYGLASSATRNWIDGMMPQPTTGKLSDLPCILAKTHMGLVLRSHHQGDMVALEVETPNGSINEIIISDRASAALSFVVNEPLFDIDALPGDLFAEEKSAIAQVLEETGLFSRVLL
jgi:hypothetical protein